MVRWTDAAERALGQQAETSAAPQQDLAFRDALTSLASARRPSLKAVTVASRSDPDRILETLLKDYERLREPIPVSFREMAPFSSARRRATHALHSYPARLLAQIPAFFLSTTTLGDDGLVVDPFCGSGTVLLEAILTGREAMGADANPLARLVSEAKVTPIAPARVEAACDRLLRGLPAVAREPAGLLNPEYWFYPHVRRDLARIADALRRVRDREICRFLEVVFSSVIRDVSLADPRLSVPVRLRSDQYPEEHSLRGKTEARLRRLRTINVLGVFRDRCATSVKLMAELVKWNGLGRCASVVEDARVLRGVDDGTVALVITSPPYLGAQKYIRASSLSLTWLGQCSAGELRALEDENIGREHYPKQATTKLTPTGIRQADELLAEVHAVNQTRAHIAAIYLNEMNAAMSELARILRGGGYAVVVIGSSTISGYPFSTPDYVTEIAVRHNLELKIHLVDTIRSRALFTKRHWTASIIESESILLFRRRERDIR